MSLNSSYIAFWFSFYLANARAAGVGKHEAASVAKGLCDAIALNGGTNLLGSGRDGKKALGLDALSQHLLHDAGTASHVLLLV